MNLRQTYSWYVKEGYLKALTKGELTLYNYTTKCVCKGNWNYYTRNARGLILDQQGNYIARPFPKFWVVGELEETYPQNLPQEIPEVAIKYDGSLVIIFYNPKDECWDAITRGCWDNVQTRFAKQWLETNSYKLNIEYTYCFELIAPWNKIVVDYQFEKMVLIGRFDQYGLDVTYAELSEIADQEDLISVEFFEKPLSELEEEVKYLPENQEGYVLRYSNGYRVKLKSPWYQEMHKEI